MKKRAILVAEDEAATAHAIKARLEAHDEFLVDVVSTGLDALRALSHAVPDALVLDATLPDVPGWEICKVIRSRARTARLPVILLGDGSGSVGPVRGFELGADDFLAKPFDPCELEARLKAVLRRNRMPSHGDERDHFVGAHIDAHFVDILVMVDQRPVQLTKRELYLLRCFVWNRNRILDRGALLADVWDSRPLEDRVVDAAIWRLRTKLGVAGSQIETVPGFGYRFNEPEK